MNEKIEDALNKQIALEADASSTYLAMASWCDREGLTGCSNFFYSQSDEEREHMLKIVHYVNEMDGHAIIPMIEQPRNDYDSIQEVFKLVYQQEKNVTASIYKIMTLANEEGDHASSHFLQWYVAEQREEETLVREILDKIRLIGTGGQSLYYIDKELDKINNRRLAMEAAADKGGAE